MTAVALQSKPQAAVVLSKAVARGGSRFRAITDTGVFYGAESVRDPDPAWCVALLTPKAFAKPKPNASMQSWWLAVHPDAVSWRRESESMTFSAAAWS